jgi:exopolysaccharide biosynthesis polyprenyl glycosylphosphotransferase
MGEVRTASRSPEVLGATRHGRDRGLVRQRLLVAKVALAGMDVVALAALAIGVAELVLGQPLWIGRRTTPAEAAVTIAVVGLAAPFLWRRLGMYRVSGGWPLHIAARRAAVGAGAMLMVIFALVVVFKVNGVSRAYLACIGVGTAYWLMLSRMIAGGLLRRWRARGGGVNRVLVVGEGVGAERFASTLSAHPELGMVQVGAVLPIHEPGDGRLHDLDELRRLLTEEVVDEVVICIPFERWPVIRDCIQVAEEQGKTVRIPLWVVGELASRNRIDEVAGIPLLSLTSTPDDALHLAWKRATDLLGAVVGLAVLAVPLAVAAIAIKRHDGGPVLFRQVRVGRHGRHFELIKLRTMAVDAERRMDEVAHLNEREEVAFKAADDPRITAVGRVLRRYSLDEVPQFVNVLRGDMSLVGPRPPVPGEVKLYDPRHRRRLSVKPGMTGLWQVSHRQEASFESWVELDLRYIDTWTLLNDLRILLRTIPAVLRGTGA